MALILVPILFALMGLRRRHRQDDAGRHPQDRATGVMLMFAIQYFGVMIDAGLFDPIVGLRAW